MDKSFVVYMIYEQSTSIQIDSMEYDHNNFMK